MWNPGAPRVLCVSLPKAGTHLLERAVCLHPALYRRLAPTINGKELRRRGGAQRFLSHLAPGQVVVSHLRFDPELVEVSRDLGVRPVFMIRDPRDVVISQVRYVVSRRDHWAHDLFESRSPYERLRLAIVGDRERHLPSLAERLAAYEGWLRSDVFLLRFEDLVGEAGGGDAARQIEVVADLYRFLGVVYDDARVADVCGRLFSNESPTFRKGTIGQWREVLDDDLTDLIRELAGSQLERYGYGG